jgi:hypothetical protein
LGWHELSRKQAEAADMPVRSFKVPSSGATVLTAEELEHNRIMMAEMKEELRNTLWRTAEATSEYLNALERDI